MPSRRQRLAKQLHVAHPSYPDLNPTEGHVGAPQTPPGATSSPGASINSPPRSRRYMYRVERIQFLLSPQVVDDAIKLRPALGSRRSAASSQPRTRPRSVSPNSLSASSKVRIILVCARSAHKPLTQVRVASAGQTGGGSNMSALRITWAAHAVLIVAIFTRVGKATTENSGGAQYAGSVFRSG